ncbi:unnamed protein product [Sphagnum balticum]
MINTSIIEAIKRVYSQEVGEELQRIVESPRGLLQQPDLTNTLCEMLTSFGSKMVTEESCEQGRHFFGTPQREGGSVRSSKKTISPILGKF